LLMNRIIDDESRVEISSLSTKQVEIAPVVDPNRVTLLVDKNVDEVAMDEDSDDESKKSKSLKQKDLPTVPNPEHVIIRKDYDPKSKQTVSSKPTTDTYFKSPLTGELIPASSMSEHMRISMLDPRWIEQKQKEKKEKEDQEEVLASGFSIEKNLKRLAEYRSDVFGSGADEVIIGRKVGEEEEVVDNKIIWEGNAGDKAAKRPLTGATVEEQIRAIHQSQGFDDDKLLPGQIQQQPKLQGQGQSSHQQQQQMMMSGYKMLNVQQAPPPGPPQIRPLAPPPVYEPPRVSAQLTDYPEEPTAKRQKTEDQLIPEATYLEQNAAKGPIKFNVQIPNVPDKPEWNLKGQLIPFTMPLTDTVSVIKNKLVDYLNMAIAKQKLQYDGMFIKDTNSLAFYNIPNDATIHLQMKERGGRKK